MMSAPAGCRAKSFGPSGKETPGDPDIRALAARLGLRGLRYRSFTPPPIAAAVAPPSEAVVSEPVAEAAPVPMPAPAPELLGLASSNLPTTAPPEAAFPTEPPPGLGFPLLAQAFARSAGATPTPAADPYAPFAAFAALRHAGGAGGR